MLQQQGPVGGSNGVTVTVANSAATGDGFAAVTSTSATFIFDTSWSAYGNESFKLATSATSVVCNATWTYTGVATAQERIYFKATDWTSTQNAGLRMRASTTQACRITFDSTGHVQIKNTTNGVVSTGSVALTAGVGYRLEVTCTQGATGTVSYAVYDLATETLQDSQTAVTGNYGTANITESGFGFFTATANINPWWFANLATTDAGFPIGVGGAFVALADSETLTDALGIATGSTPVTLGDAQTLTDALAVVMSAPVAMSNAQTLTATLAVAVSTPSVGVPFRQDIYGVSAYLAVEAAWGADLTQPAGTWTWYDVTADVMYNPGISATFGRGDETSQSQPSSAQLALLNLSGNYSDFVTTGIYGAGVRKGTPLRVRQNLGTGFVQVFQGRIFDLTPTWDTSGKLPIVKVQAAGTLRRLGQPKGPAQSALRYTIPTTSPISYWPLEDGVGSTIISQVVAGGPTLYPSGIVNFASSDGPGGSGPVADLSAGGQLKATLPTIISSSYRIEFVCKFPSFASGDFVAIMDWYTPGGGIDFWEIDATDVVDGGLYVQWISGVTFGGPYVSNIQVDDGNWHHVRIDMSNAGGNQQIVVTLDGIAVINQTTTRAWSPVAQLYINPDGDISEEVPRFGHLAIWAPWSGTANTAAAATGYIGEAAHARIGRLAAEQGTPMAITGTSNVTMGPQPIDTPLNIYRDAEKADLGVLYDGFSDGLGYICRSGRYNQPVALSIDAGASGGQLAPPFAPANDDQRLLNQFTATGAGVSFTVADTSSPLSVNAVGQYAQADSYNTADATYVRGIAGMRVNYGTVYGLRYPNLALNFLNPQASTLAATWLALAASSLPIGFRTDVQKVSTSAINHPPGTFSLIIEGYTLRITNLEWSIAANCSSYLPNRGWTILSPTQGRIAPATTTLNTAMSTTSTGTITILTPRPWSTLAADYTGGASIQIDSEQITVTGAGAWSAGSQTLTVSARSQNGVISTHLVGAAITLWKPGKVLL